MSPPTPGPWTAELHRNGGATIRQIHDPRNERGAIASLTFAKTAEIKADARLIAAAPELRDFLEAVVRAIGDWRGTGTPDLIVMTRLHDEGGVLLSRIEGQP